MKVLLIGGTGTISTAISQQLQEQGHDLTLFNRGQSKTRVPDGAKLICGNIHNEEETAALLAGQKFDVVANFIAFGLGDVQRDYRLFKDIAKQYIFISSASAYQKPPVDPVITESTPLSNPYWGYSHNKVLCEDWLMERFKQDGFPVTIVRPSHTYSDRSVPVALHGNNGSWQVLKRMLEGKPVIIPGDGSSLWTVTHNSDFAKGFIGLMANPHTIGQAIHITNDERLTWTQIHEIIADKLDVKLNPCYVSSDLLIATGKSVGYDFEGPLLGDKTHTVIFDNAKLKRLVPGFTATMRFDQGIEDTIKHILDNPEYQKEDPEFDEFSDKVYNAIVQLKENF